MMWTQSTFFFSHWASQTAVIFKHPDFTFSKEVEFVGKRCSGGILKKFQLNLLQLQHPQRAKLIGVVVEWSHLTTYMHSVLQCKTSSPACCQFTSNMTCDETSVIASSSRRSAFFRVFPRRSRLLTLFWLSRDEALHREQVTRRKSRPCHFLQA